MRNRSRLFAVIAALSILRSAGLSSCAKSKKRSNVC